MKTTHRHTLIGLSAGILLFGLAACDSAPSISGSRINGPIAAPTGPIGSSGTAGSTGSGGPEGATSRPGADGTSSSMPPPSTRNPGSSGP